MIQYEMKFVLRNTNIIIFVYLQFLMNNKIRNRLEKNLYSNMFMNDEKDEI